jgi:hypothetical protein
MAGAHEQLTTRVATLSKISLSDLSSPALTVTFCYFATRRLRLKKACVSCQVWAQKKPA